jgi:O-antigen/teichoic acid export membrane protein
MCKISRLPIIFKNLISLKDHLSRIRFQHLWESVGTYYPSVLRMAGAAFQFLNSILIAQTFKAVGSAEFFFWSMIIQTATCMASYGLEQLALRDVPRLQTKGVKAVRNYLSGVHTISVSLALLIGLGLSLYAGLSGGWAWWQILIPIGLAAMTTVMILGEVLKGLSRPITGVFFGHFVPVVLFTISIFIFGRQVGEVGLICLWIGCFLLAAVLIRFCPLPEIAGNPFQKPEPEIVKSLLKGAAPVFCGAILSNLSFIIPFVILKSGSHGTEVSFVSAAFRLSILFSVLAGAVHAVFAPQISRAAETLDAKAVVRAYGKAIGFSVVALGLPLIIGIVFSAPIMGIFDESFRAGANTLRCLLFGNLLTLILGPVLQLLIMINCSQWLPRLGMIKFIIAITAAWFLVTPYGGVGMVIATSGAFIIEEMMALYLVVIKLR